MAEGDEMGQGYFKVSMDAARAIVNETEGPNMLAAYVTVCGHAYGEDRRITAAGAKAIRQGAGTTDYRSKLLLADMMALCFGDRTLLKPTPLYEGNAPIHYIEQWDGSYAYLPSLLIQKMGEGTSMLAKLAASPDYDSDVRRDALLLLLHAYAVVAYADWFGCPPEEMAYRDFTLDGEVHDFALGHYGEMGGANLWLAGATDTWRAWPRVMTSLFGKDEETAQGRFWPALWCLKDLGLLITVVSVQLPGGRAYPLWVANPGYREALGTYGVVPNLAMLIHNAACATGHDPDNLVMRYAVEDMERQGSDLYFCVAKKKPIVRGVLAPRLHAPTPINLEGLEEAGGATVEIKRAVAKARRQADSV
jgi:hypothetical protein